jgi:hypothetical protein
MASVKVECNGQIGLSVKQISKVTMQTLFKAMVLPLAIAALVSFTACMSTSDRTSGRVIDDRNVNSKVKGALEEATVYKFEDVDVTTHNGVVQLSGWADTEEQKNTAGQIAGRIEGVNEVINNISLKVAPTGRGSGYPPRDTNAAPPKVDAPANINTNNLPPKVD